MTDNVEVQRTMQEQADSKKKYTRFDISQRLEHFIFLLSFTVLGITGLVQKYSESTFSQQIIRSLGGIENTRLIHHWAAVVMMVVSIFHILNLLYRIYVLRVPWSMMPVIEDIKHLYVAGAFGTYTNLENAFKLGIFPELPNADVHPIGNGSLSGAYATLMSIGKRREAKDIAERTVYIDLLVDVEFMEEYSRALYLPGAKEYFPKFSKTR